MTLNNDPDLLNIDPSTRKVENTMALDDPKSDN